jgi:aspartate aminotransferase
VQHAGLAALRAWDSGQRNAKLVRANRDEALPKLVDAGLLRALPEGGWYALLDVRATGLDGAGFADRLLLEHGVSVAPAAGFALRPEQDPAGRVLALSSAEQARHLLRIAFCGDPAELRSGVERIVAFVASRTTESP